jgi:hypothetical protein
MPTIKLKLSAEEMRMLDELCDFEGEDREGTLRLCLQHHHAHMRLVAAEADEARARREANRTPEADDEIPM